MAWEFQVLKQSRLSPTVSSEITWKKYCSEVRCACYTLLSCSKAVFSWIKWSCVSCRCHCSQHMEENCFHTHVPLLECVVLRNPYYFQAHGFVLKSDTELDSGIPQLSSCLAPQFGICPSFWAVPPHRFLEPLHVHLLSPKWNCFILSLYSAFVHWDARDRILETRVIVNLTVNSKAGVCSTLRGWGEEEYCIALKAQTLPWAVLAGKGELNIVTVFSTCLFKSAPLRMIHADLENATGMDMSVTRLLLCCTKSWQAPP